MIFSTVKRGKHFFPLKMLEIKKTFEFFTWKESQHCSDLHLFTLFCRVKQHEAQAQQFTVWIIVKHSKTKPTGLECPEVPPTFARKQLKEERITGYVINEATSELI